MFQSSGIDNSQLRNVLLKVRGITCWFSSLSSTGRHHLSILSLLYLSLSSQFFLAASSHETNPKIYDLLDSSHYCFRRLNQTHQIGCASNINGNNGIIKEIRPDHLDEDIDFLSKSGSNPPFVAVINPLQLANLSLILLLKSLGSDRVTGLLVLDDSRPSALSADCSCPNEFSSLYVNNSDHGHCRTQQWNLPTPDHYEGLLFQDLSFPVFLLRNKTQIETLRQKMAKHSTEVWPKLAVELLSPMHAAKDSITCLRRSRMSSRFNIYSDVLCDPLGGYNIFHHTIDFSKTSTIPLNSVVVMAARQDSFSIFEGLAPGADSALTSVVVLLAVAEMLNQPDIKKDLEAVKDKSLLLALFDGEAFDYIGSSDTVFQLEKNTFPMVDPMRISTSSQITNKYPKLNLTQLSHYIELNQLAQYTNQSEPQKIYLHKNLLAPPLLQDLIKTIQKEAQGLTNLSINKVADNRPLPPSSAQSFLKKRSDNDFAVLVTANHEKEYINKLYNSFHEDGSDMNEDLSDRLTDLATLFGRVAYHLVKGESLHPTLKANKTIVDGLLTCFLKNSNCELFQTVQDPKSSQGSTKPRPPYSTYVSVYGVSNVLREYTRLLLFRFTGKQISSANSSEECSKLSKDNKDKQFYYLWLNGESMKGECIRSSTFMVPTISPSINPDTLEVIDANLPFYSLWTESKWQESELRIFVIPSPIQKILIVLLGVAILLLSFVIVWFISKNSDQLFAHEQNCAGSRQSSPVQNRANSNKTLANGTKPLTAENSNTQENNHTNQLISENGIDVQH